MGILRVSATSKPSALATAITLGLRSDGAVCLESIGPHATNQAVKGIAVARALLRERGLDLTVQPGFTTRVFDGEPRSALQLSVTLLGAPGAHTGHPADETH